MNREIPIITIDVQNELDIMLSHRRGMQFSKYCGIALSEQTRFATAISELCRNVIKFAKTGTIAFSIANEGEQHSLFATITDRGPGIRNIESILDRKPEGFRGRGVGIIFARKLSDGFKIETSSKGTQVKIKKNIPPGKAVISRLVIQGWLKHLANEPSVSPYEELKARNIQLLELTDELSAKARVVDLQMEEIKLLNKQLASSNQQMKEFTYAISHDLKTPLSSLNIAAEYLDLHPRGKESPIYRQILGRSVKRLDKTVRSLIEILDLQNPDKRIIRNLRFEAVFNVIHEEHQQFIRAADAIINVDFSTAPQINYIEGYLQSILHNLLSNAIKYREPSRRLLVSFKTDKVKEGVKLTVTDNGTGMDMEKIREKLFLPFNRFAPVQDGKGIGLYMIKGMVESNGGKVSVESKPGVGTAFNFILIPHQQQ